MKRFELRLANAKAKTTIEDDNIIIEVLDEDTALMTTKETLITFAVQEKEEQYNIIVEPADDEIKSLLERSEKDEKSAIDYRFNKELMDQLIELDEQLPFRIIQIMNQFGNLDEEVFNSEILMQTVLELSRVYNIDYVFNQIEQMSLEEAEEIFGSSYPFRKMMIYLKEYSLEDDEV